MISSTNNDTGKTEYHFIDSTKEKEISIVQDDKLLDIDRIESHEKSTVLYTRSNYVVILDNNYCITDSFNVSGEIIETDCITYTVLPTEKK